GGRREPAVRRVPLAAVPGRRVLPALPVRRGRSCRRDGRGGRAGRGALVLAGVPDRRGESRGLHLRGRPRRGGGPRAAGAPRLAPGPAAGARVRAGSPLPPIDLRRRRTGGREGRSMTASAVPLRPRVRYVECQPLEQGGQRSFLLSDPTGLAPNPVVVSPAVVFLLQRFDGR